MYLDEFDIGPLSDRDSQNLRQKGLALLTLHVEVRSFATLSAGYADGGDFLAFLNTKVPKRGRPFFANLFDKKVKMEKVGRNRGRPLFPG